MTTNWNFADPIDEIYAIRRNISERCGNNIRWIVLGVAQETADIRRAGKDSLKTRPTPARRTQSCVFGFENLIGLSFNPLCSCGRCP